jgi:hypothetical protein
LKGKPKKPSFPAYPGSLSLKSENLKERFFKGKGVRPDLLVKPDYPEGKRILIVEVKANGQPRLARQAVNQLLRYKKLFPDSYEVFLAPYISPKAGEIWTSAASETVPRGTLFISFSNFFSFQA